MPYSYIEHTSDIGISAAGADIKEAFESGVEAMLSVMFDLATVSEKQSVEVAAEAPSIELLFVEVLNEVLSLQGRDSLALKRLHAVEIVESVGRCSFKGTAHGEPFDREKHDVRTEVKGATYSGLRHTTGEDGAHTLECILDV